MTSPPEILTFGCRLNLVDSEVIRRRAAEAGLENAVIVNTCAVTAEAVRQARQAIRRAARTRPGIPVIVTGCAAEIAPGDFAAMPEVTRVLGNAEKLTAAAWAPRPDLPRVAVGGIRTAADAPRQRLGTLTARSRGFVQVQTGCDHRCTFCIIPFGRGPSRSVPVDAVQDEARALVAAGVHEIVLTGVDLTAYGRDLPARPALGDLVVAILGAVPGLARLRLSSIDVAEVDARLEDVIAHEPRVMPHLHLSLQAGDDLILKRMKRRHTRDQAIAFCDRLRTRRPGLVFGADLIAGFPTETDAMFARSLSLIEACGLSFLHVFPFSPREGTPAARMPRLPPAEIAARAGALRDAGRRALAAHLTARVGTRATLLTERGPVARAEDYTPVRLASPAAPGTLLPVRLTGHDGETAMAEAA